MPHEEGTPEDAARQPAAAPVPLRGGPARLVRRRWFAPAAAAVAIAAAAGGALVAAGGDRPPAARADAVPYDGRSPREPSGRGTRVIVELPRPALGAAGIAEPGRQRAYVRSLQDESAALRSALEARGIRLGDVVTYARTLNGFAATVRTSDLAELPSLGVRAQPVRRFYPAAGEPARVPGLAPPAASAPLGGRPVAVLDSGVDAGHRLLTGRLDPGYDAVERDDDPAVAASTRGARRETSGSALAGILVAAGERVLPIRVAGAQPGTRGTGAEDVAVSDQLLAGLERAVDPDADGATDDHVTVAVVGVNSPYAGFGRAPEARAVAAAADLGTLVVAPAGGEGRAAGPAGTVGSPAAAPDALAVGALAAPRAVARIDVELGGADARGAVLLAGAPPPAGLRTAGPVEASDSSALPAEGAGALRGRVAVVRAGEAPVARAAAAAAAGARAVLLAEPRSRPLPAIPAGRVAVPVLGVTGPAAAAVLEEAPGAVLRVEAATTGDAGSRAPGSGAAAARSPGDDGSPAVSPFSSRGPAAGGELAPDLVASGAGLTALAGGGGAVVGGTAVAAARAAAVAARLARARPSASPRELRDALIGAAEPDPRLPVRAAGAGVLRAPAATAAIVARTVPARRSDPCPEVPACVRIRVANQGAAPAELEAALQADPGTRASRSPGRLTIPPGGRREVEISVAAGTAGIGAGRLVLRPRGAGGEVVTEPWSVALGAAPAVPLGPLAVVRDDGRVTGVRFALGAFRRGDPLGAGTSLALAERLALTLIRARDGRVVRRLTPPGGARELLPAEYAYTLPAGTRRALQGGGRFAVRAAARSPRGGPPAVARSRPFRP